VRKDSKFKKLGLEAAQFANNPRAVVDILLKHKQLLQRPVLARGNRAIIGRPKQRIVEFLSSSN
jgi:arsenate reductase